MCGESAVQKRDGFSKTEKALMLLSNETREGLRITVHSFVAIVRELLQDPKFFQPGRLLHSVG